MSIPAVYLSAVAFQVEGDLTSDFCPGRAVRCDCGVDGPKYGFVNYPSYGAPSTTITLIESDGLTSNLSAVEFGVPRPNSVNNGNISIFDVWGARGVRTVDVIYKDGANVSVTPGIVHIDNGLFERIYQCSGFDVPVSGLALSTWYHVYAKPPTNGLVLSASDISYSTTAPSVDNSKGGKLYHPTDGTKRCIGWFKSASGSAVINWFSNDGGTWTPDAVWSLMSGVAPSNVWTLATCNVPIGGIAVNITAEAYYINADAGLFISQYSESALSTGSQVVWVNPTKALHSDVNMVIRCNSNKGIYYRFNIATTNTIYANITSFKLPKSL